VRTLRDEGANSLSKNSEGYMVFTGDERVYETVTTEGLGKYIHNVKKASTLKLLSNIDCIEIFVDIQ